jgi:hypothetical protein
MFTRDGELSKSCNTLQFESYDVRAISSLMTIVNSSKKGNLMKHIPDNKIQDAKDHLSAAKTDLKEAAQDGVAKKTASVGERVKDGVDSLIDKTEPDNK